MALMLSKTYDPLVAAGAPEGKAREAAEEIAGFENRLTRIETDIAIIKSKLETEVAAKIALLVMRGEQIRRARPWDASIA